jgi:hypothetical protein
MDLRRSDLDGLNRLAALWKGTPGAEFEAMLSDMDLTGWQDVIGYLRALGMREAPKTIRMNICLSNDIRITLEGSGVIQAYCRDNTIQGKPFTAMLKEAIADAEPVVLGNYGVKAKLKREIPLAADDERVKEVIARWPSLGKHFRVIQRYEFVAAGGLPLRFDVSLVRENAGRPARTFQEARVTTAMPKYEVEVELTADRAVVAEDKAVAHVVRGLSWLLQGRQRSYVLVGEQTAAAVRADLMGIFGLRGANGGNRNRNRGGAEPPFRFPGPQPTTLERKNIAPVPTPGVPHLRTKSGGYNATDKADGLRCLLFVFKDKRIYLADMGGRVYATGKQISDDDMVGVVLDGEWIRKLRNGSTVSRFYAFDILAGKRGDTGIATQPFTVAGAIPGSTAVAGTRLAIMTDVVAELGSATQIVRGVPASHTLQITTKRFRSVPEGDAIFTSACAGILGDAATSEYHTDGIILTPNAEPLPLGGGTWAEQFKWKPAAENTIDFLVVVDVDRDKSGKPISMAEKIGTKYRDDTGATVRYKTLRLFVGSSRDAAFQNPRMTVLGGEPLPTSLESGEWREVEFRPTDPYDPMAGICYCAIDAGATDPAGAAPAAQTLESGDAIFARSGDVIQSNMIVEMAYDPTAAPGWRWSPLRVRHDKTERWLAQQRSGGRRGGTMNADWVANSIWNSIHNPITPEAIRTGIVEYCPAPQTQVARGVGYRMPARDLVKVQCMANFHNEFIKQNLLLKRTLSGGGKLCDIGMGAGEDMNLWITAGASYVLGCDVAASALNDPETGAYRRLLDKMIAMGGRDRVPPMVFAQADAARRLMTGEAALGDTDRALLQSQFGTGGPAAEGFDLTSCTFVAPAFFRDENTLAGFLENLADTVRVGGHFVGCCMDGDAIARMFAGSGDATVVGKDGAVQAWAITRRYGAGIGSSVPPSALGLGLAVDVDFISGGTTRTEYLVSWPYFQSRLAECGLELLTAEECAAMGLPASTQMFRETWEAASVAGETYAMTGAMQRYSDLHRWWVMRRRVDRRPEPPAVGAPAPAVVEGAAVPGPAVVELAALEAAANAAAIRPLAGPEAAANAAAKPPAPAAAEPVESREYLVRWENAEPDQRLGAEYMDWPRYLTLETPFETEDLTDPTVKYPSVFAAVLAARFQRAMDPADKAATLAKTFFSTTGKIHTAFEASRARAAKTGASAAELAKTILDEKNTMMIAVGKAKLKAEGLTFKADEWNAVKEGIYRAYLRQRFERDDRFREAVEAIQAKGGVILYANGKEAEGNELGVGVRVDGTVVGGENKIGRWMLELGA